MNDKFFVPFETAEALKEKGFNEEKPTYHEVVDWLAKAHHIYIGMNIINDVPRPFRYGCEIARRNRRSIFTESNPTREAALNAAIVRALQLIDFDSILDDNKDVLQRLKGGEQ